MALRKRLKNITPVALLFATQLLFVLSLPSTMGFICRHAWLVGALIMLHRQAHAFLPQLLSQQSKSHLAMVRNIDLPEAIVLYGDDLYLHNNQFHPAWDSLRKECREVSTPVIVIGDTDPSESNVVFYRQQVAPPSPHDVWNVIQLCQIQPRAFGGSAGFGASQMMEPPRPPMPARTVVFAGHTDQTRAARAAGMRVLSLNANDQLSDAFVDWSEIADLWLEDIATPGSYWLNPPHPRDDLGAKVDVEQVIEWFRTGSGVVGASNGGKDDGEMSEEEMARILADLDPL